MTRPGIVLVTTSFPRGGDGSEAAGAFVADLAVELGRTIPVRVVAPGFDAVRERFAEGVEVFRFPAPKKPLSTLSVRSPGDLAWLARVVTGGRAATLDAVRASPTAHQLALWALPSGYWAREASRVSGVPYSVWTLGSDIWSLGRVPLVRGLLSRVLRNAHTCFSDGLALASATAALSRGKVEFLPSSRSLEAPPRASRARPPYRLLFLGRWHPNKGIDLLLDALGRLSNEDWTYIERVEICGGGPMEADVHRGIAALRAHGCPVVVQGFLDMNAARDAFARADYVLIPSRIESIPVVFSDAMQQGCAVVAMPVGDLPDLIREGGVGFCAETLSPNAFADALRAAIRASCDEFAPRLREMAERFSVRSVARRAARLAEGGGA